MSTKTRRPPPFRHTYSQTSGARPIDPASTHQTGFVGVFTLSHAVIEITPSGCSLHLESPDCDLAGELIIDDPRAAGLGPEAAMAVPLDRIHTALLRMMRPLRALAEIGEWRDELARELAIEMMSVGHPDTPKISQRAEDIWDDLTRRQRRDWLTWVRQHPGFKRLELALSGYFENGGRVAHIVVSVHGPDGGVVPRDLLVDAFANKPDLAMLCAPGLDPVWQTALLEYAGPRGRGDLFAIVDGPPSWPVPPSPEGTDSGPYAISRLATAPRPEITQVLHANDLDTWSLTDEGGFGAAFGPWIWVDNPTSQRAQERYILVPPSGHIAGAIAGADLSPNGGVQQALTLTSISGTTEPGIVFTEEQMHRVYRSGINPLLIQPRHGLRMASERTLATNPRWIQISSRRCWLLIARSLRAGLQWAIQSSSPDRLDAMEASIDRFLAQQYEKGVIVGESADDAWLVDRDEPDEFAVWVRPAGLQERVQVVIYHMR